MVVRFNKHQLLENQQTNSIGVEGDTSTATGGGKLTESEKIVTATKQKIAEGATPAVGISASNSGKGHDPVAPVEDGDDSFTPTVIEGTVEEEPGSIEDSPEVTPDGSVTKMELGPRPKS